MPSRSPGRGGITSADGRIEYSGRVSEKGNSAYAGVSGLPALVSAAVELADEIGFDNSCTPEQGRLLSVLARGRNGGRVGETGTGCAVGLSWMLDVTDASTSYVSIELDRRRAKRSAALLAGHENVQIIFGDWTQLVEHGPFDLLVLDGGGKGKDPAVDTAIDPTAGWLAPGGTIVLDDFIPAGQPGAAQHDPARHYWLNHPALHATEIRLTSATSTIVGVRMR